MAIVLVLVQASGLEPYSVDRAAALKLTQQHAPAVAALVDRSTWRRQPGKHLNRTRPETSVVNWLSLLVMFVLMRDR